MNRSRRLVLIALLMMCASGMLTDAVPAQTREAALAPVVIVPQRSAWTVRGTAAAEITAVALDVRIRDRAASTTMDISLFNPGPVRTEAELLVPIPGGSVVRGFTFQGSGPEPSARILARAEARSLYEAIVSRSRDPAILEFMGYSLVRTCVFPVEARGKQKVRLIYEQLLPADGVRVDYLVPRTEALDYRVPWDIKVRIQSSAALSTVYSPTHDAVIDRLGSGEFQVSLSDAAGRQPGPFCLSYLLEKSELTASLIAYPDPAAGGGYFLLLAGPPSGLAAREPLQREIVMVLDRSGSMRDGRLEQARRAASELVGSLRPGESFNVIAYNEAVEPFAPGPLAVNEERIQQAARFLLRLTPQGGTNIYDALAEALHPAPRPNLLPIVLFLTDGIPTVGRTDESEIRRLVTDGNAFHRRIFTFGIGSSYNAPLLDAMALESRGAAASVAEGEPLGPKMTQLFRRLNGPVLSDVEVRVSSFPQSAGPRVSGLVPAVMPDLFEGDQLVLLGQYHGTEPLQVTLAGRRGGERREFHYTFDLSSGSTANAFVCRLWASRKIGRLIDAIRQLGPDTQDPRRRELVDEIIRLSLRFGILTEYTSFFAEEGTDLSRDRELSRVTDAQLQRKAAAIRVGKAAITQAENVKSMAAQKSLNLTNAYLDAEGTRVTPNGVRQVNDRAFFKKGGQWVDSALAQRRPRPDRIVEVGSAELIRLAESLARENRQGTLALRGEILLESHGEIILVR
jgi:Ca-activated chloride channel homolog